MGLSVTGCIRIVQNIRTIRNWDFGRSDATRGEWQDESEAFEMFGWLGRIQWEPAWHAKSVRLENMLVERRASRKHLSVRSPCSSLTVFIEQATSFLKWHKYKERLHKDYKSGQIWTERQCEIRLFPFSGIPLTSALARCRSWNPPYITSNAIEMVFTAGGSSDSFVKPFPHQDGRVDAPDAFKTTTLPPPLSKSWKGSLSRFLPIYHVYWIIAVNFRVPHAFPDFNQEHFCFLLGPAQATSEDSHAESREANSEVFKHPHP